MIDNTAYKNTSVGLIPSNWEVKKIKEIGDVSSGGTPDTTKLRYWNGDINWCTPTDITALKNKFLGDTKTKITEEGLKSSSAKILPPFSIIVNGIIIYLAFSYHLVCFYIRLSFDQTKTPNH